MSDAAARTKEDTGDSEDGEQGGAMRSNQCPINTTPPQFSFEGMEGKIWIFVMEEEKRTGH